MSTLDSLEIKLLGDISQFESSMRRARGLMDDLGRGAAAPKAIDASLKGLLGTIGGVTGGLLSAAAAAKALGAGLSYNREIESMKLGVGSIVSAFHDITDAQGKTLQGAEKLAAAQRATGAVFEQLKKDAIETTATLPQLVGAFQATVGPASAVGLSLDQSRKITVAMVQTMGALGIEMGQARQEIASILNGTISTDSRLANTLGITSEMVRNWKAQGKLADELLAKLDAFVVAGKEAGNTWAGLTSTLQDNLSALAGLGTAGAFDAIKDRLRELNETAFGADAKKRAVEWGEILKGALNDALAVAKNIGFALAWAADKFAAGLLATRQMMIGMGARIGTVMARDDVVRETARTRGLKGPALDAILGPTQFVTRGKVDPGTGTVEGGKVDTLSGAPALARLAREGTISAAEKTLAEKVLKEATGILAGEMTRAGSKVYDDLAKAYGKLLPAPVGKAGDTLTSNAKPPPSGPGSGKARRSDGWHPPMAAGPEQVIEASLLAGEAAKDAAATADKEFDRWLKDLGDDMERVWGVQIEAQLDGVRQESDARKRADDDLRRQRESDARALAAIQQQADDAHLSRVLQAGQLAADLAAKAIKGESITAGDVIRGGGGLAGGAIGAGLGMAGGPAGALAGASLGSSIGSMAGTLGGAIADRLAGPADEQRLAAERAYEAAEVQRVAAERAKEASESQIRAAQEQNKAAMMTLISSGKGLQEQIALAQLSLAFKKGQITESQYETGKLDVEFNRRAEEEARKAGINVTPGEGLPADAVPAGKNPAGQDVYIVGSDPAKAGGKRQIMGLGEYIQNAVSSVFSNGSVPVAPGQAPPPPPPPPPAYAESGGEIVAGTAKGTAAAGDVAAKGAAQQAGEGAKNIDLLSQLKELFRQLILVSESGSDRVVGAIRTRDQGAGFFDPGLLMRASRLMARRVNLGGNVLRGASGFVGG